MTWGANLKLYMSMVGQNHGYIRCINGIFGRDITKYMVIYGVYMLPNLSIPNVPFSVHLATLIRSRFQVKPATLMIPIDLWGGGGGVLRYPVPKGLLFLIFFGVIFHCLRSLFLFCFYIYTALANPIHESWCKAVSA